MMRWIICVLLSGWSCLVFGTDYYVGGAGASDNNPGTAAQPFATIQKAATVARSGDVVRVRSGVYRETITPANSGVTFQAEAANVTISGLNEVGNDGWTVHNGQIYKKSITFPVANNFNEYINDNNTTLLANQVFKNGEMMHLARWPDINTMDDLFDKTKMRNANQTQSMGDNSLSDSGLGSLGIGNFAGAWVSINGWFLQQTRLINSGSGGTINWGPATTGPGPKFRKFYFVTNHLGLLNAEKEWHYQDGVLYFRQPGGGSPTGVEYKVRNWGFDLRNKTNTTVKGFTFHGCDPVHTSENSNNTTVDNIRATYINHSFIAMHIGSGGNTRAARESGLRLRGPNSVIKNSEIRYAANHGIWLGEHCRAENNYLSHIAYDGGWGAAFRPWHNTSNQTITRNTVYKTSRGAIEMSGDFQSSNRNMEIGYNDFSMFNTLSIDGGAIYSQLQTDHTGTRIHHNWFHDTGVYENGDTEGTQVTGVYMDQASGPCTVDHNVHWNGNECDFYSEIENAWRDASTSTPLKLYNNTFVNTDRPYISYAHPQQAPIQINNIYRGQLSSPNKPLNVTFSLMHNVDPMFLGNGGGGLNYRLQAGSPARNTGTAIAGITDGSVGTPDMGAYEYGGEDWVPGYKAVPLTYNNNASPTVAITAPANNANVAVGTAITISATAADSDGNVTRVEFFDGNTKIGEDATSPYSFVWNNASAGSHTLTARATDNQNATTTSAAVTIVVAAGNTPPSVSITSPTTNSTVQAASTVTISATASDNGSVTKVEFYNGTTKLGEDTTSPYSFAWTNVPVGTHRLTARATDNENSSATSAVVTITVAAAPSPSPAPAPVNTPPQVALTSPSNNQQFTAGTAINIQATASDANGTVSKVEFFNGTVKLGEDTTSPYAFTWTNAAAGTHAITARATDNANATATSSVVNVSVVLESVQLNPTVTAGEDVLVTLPQNSATLSGSTTVAAATTYTWTQISGPIPAVLTGSNSLQVQLSNLTEGVYEFELTVYYGAEQLVKDQVRVTVAAGDELAEVGGIPRYFSPNSDGINDTWQWPASALTPSASVTIFNAAGEKVYENPEYDNSWDGNFGGRALQDDAYYYVISRPNAPSVKGAVRIIR